MENMQVREMFCRKYLPEYDLWSVEEKAVEKREKFGAWLLFKQKQVVYAPIQTLHVFCQKNKLDLEDMLEYMVRHQTWSVYTNI